MGNSAFSRAAGCFVPVAAHDRERGITIFLPASEPSDEGLGHSFCYVRPSPFPLDPPPPSLDPQLPVIENSTTAEKVRNPSGTTFKAISGASVSANTSTPRTVLCSEHFHSFTGVPDNRHAAFQSTASFTSLPLQPIPRVPASSGPSAGTVFSVAAMERGFSSGPIERTFMSGPLERGFMSGPLERSFMSGPLDRAFMSGPLDRGFMSGPVDVSTDKSHFSAPLAGPYYNLRLRRRMSAARFVSTIRQQAKGVLTRTLSKTSSTWVWTHKSFVPSVKQLIRRGFYNGTKESVSPYDIPSHLGCPSSDVSHNLQWAQGKAGEDRVQVVVSEEHGWLFVGIYDGFSGPDAPDFLMRNLYRSVHKELQGLLWDQNEIFDQSDEQDKGFLSTAALDYEGCIEKGQNCLARHRESYASEPIRPNNTLLEQHKHPDHQSRFLKSSDVHSIDCSGSCERRSTFKQLMDREDLDSFSFYAQSKFVSNQRNLASSMVQGHTDAAATGTGDDKTDSDAMSASGSGDIPRMPDEVSHANRLRTWKGRLSFQPSFRLRHSKKKDSHGKSLPPRCNLTNMEGTSNKFHSGLKQGDLTTCRRNSADHSSVLNALAHALEETEGAFLDMADHALPENPELALMGSCILVVLMKDKDVYVMNVGDSRAILAQYQTPENGLVDATNFCSNGESSASLTKSRDQALGLDLGHENLVDPECLHAGPPTPSSSLHAVQLSRDHSTSIEEEIIRIKTEHPDDSCCILNDRVKGSLKVTRAFGAGFLKKPRWNDALLKRFQVEYVGTAPYISCMPALHHHRLGPYDQFLVLSSDGLYQYFSNEEVISYVEWFMEKFPEGDPAQHLIEELLFRAAKKAGMDFHELLDIPQGDRRKYHDDVSVMIISLEGRIWRSWG